MKYKDKTESTEPKIIQIVVTQLEYGAIHTFIGLSNDGITYQFDKIQGKWVVFIPGINLPKPSTE